MELRNVSLIVPAYEPDDKLLSAIPLLEEAGFSDIIVVNDGSSDACDEIFEKVKEFSTVTLLVHEVNKGKGVALKTAYRYILENRPDSLGAVCVDSDGQHLPKDVLACTKEMLTGEPHIVLGCRDFTLPFVPERSRKGNNITRNVFKKFFKMDVSDTQTGLRAVPSKYYTDMLETDGERYEYENNMLLTMKDNKIPYSEVSIDTVYIEENKSSHFRPVRDSLRIYYHLFSKTIKYALSSLFCVILENLIQLVLHDSINIANTFVNELVDFLPARLISSVVNYFLNSKLVFKKKSGGSVARYYVLWLVQAAITYLCTIGVECVLGRTEGIVYFLIITVIKTLIFFASYFVQKKWVFKRDKETK